MNIKRRGWVIFFTLLSMFLLILSVPPLTWVPYFANWGIGLTIGAFLCYTAAWCFAFFSTDQQERTIWKFILLYVSGAAFLTTLVYIPGLTFTYWIAWRSVILIVICYLSCFACGFLLYRERKKVRRLLWTLLGFPIFWISLFCFVYLFAIFYLSGIRDRALGII